MTATNFVYNETPIGVVDGVNKVFTLLNSIESIEDLRIGWVDYTNFSFNWNTITLVDAPTISTGAPSVDYFKAWVVVVTTPSDKTFGDFCLDIYEDLWQNITSFQYPLSMVERYVREELMINLNKRVNPLRKVGTYSFNKAIDGEVQGYSATEINVGTIPTYTPSTGRLMIGYGEVVDYATISSTSFTSLSWLDIVYAKGIKATVAYKILTGVKKISEVMVNGFILQFADFREYKSTQEGCFAVWDGYLFLPRTTAEAVVTVTYTKDNVTPFENTDIIDFEPEYLNVVRYSVLTKLFAFRGDERLAITMQIYQDSLKHYKNYIARQVDGTNNQVKAHWYASLGSYTKSHYARR